MLIVSNHKMGSEIYGANNFQELLLIESEDLTKWCPVVVAYVQQWTVMMMLLIIRPLF